MMAEVRRRREAAKISAFEEWNRAEVDTSKVIVPPPPKTILDECPRFRILIIGRTGVGKSTICSLVFGIKDFRITGVSHHSRGIHNVEDEITFPDINPRIVIHDSPGFEAGDNRIYEKVKEFIRHRRSKVKLADQIHCIWYCISCEDLSRTSQECEEDFFSNFEKIVGKIPVIVVFTKFDQVINNARGKYLGKHIRRIQSGEISESMITKEVRKIANADYEHGRSEISKVIDPIRVGIIRTCNPSDDDSDEGLLAICPDIGVGHLTKMTFDNLENHGIRILWAAAQNNDSDLKLMSQFDPIMQFLPSRTPPIFYNRSVQTGLAYFDVNLGVSSIPFVPLVSATVFWVTFSHYFEEISKLWNLLDPSKLLKTSKIRRRFLGAIFDMRPYVFLALKALDILGPTDAPATAAVLAKTIGGITLIFDELFTRELVLRRDGQHVTPLTDDDIESALDSFRKSSLKAIMKSMIDGRNLLTQAYSRQQVGNLIEDAIRLARSENPREPLERAKSY